jgi:hypothetical protein
MLRLQKSIVIVSLLTISACSPIPIVAAPIATFTPYMAGTETALAAELASPTPWVARTETAAAVLSVTPTPVAFLTPLPTVGFLSTLPPVTALTPLPEGTFSPVLYGAGGFLLVIGGIRTDQGWLSSDQAVQYIGGEMDYDFFGPNESEAIQVRGSVPEFMPPCRNAMHASQVLPEPMVGVASNWISEKRATRFLSTGAPSYPSYIQAVTEWFHSQGNFPKEINITSVLQTDLEGDGVDEVLLSASYFKHRISFLTETDDYSVVLMRKVVGDQVVTVPLVKDYYVSSIPKAEVSYPKAYRITDAVDLNRDGTLEVIVEVEGLERSGAVVYRIDGQNVREVLRMICGAP